MVKGYKGWYYESRRHSLAAKGIRTGKRRRYIDSDKDGVPDAYDCNPNNPNEQGFFHTAKEHMVKYFKLAEHEAEHLLHEVRENTPKVWNWIKAKSHNLHEALKEGSQKFKEEHPEHTDKAAEIIDKIEEVDEPAADVELADVPETISPHEDYPPTPAPKKPSIITQYKERIAVKREKALELREEMRGMSDAQLQESAIRYKRGGMSVSDFLFGDISNPYEEELLRRVKKREIIKDEITQARRKVKEGDKDFTFWDFVSGKALENDKRKRRIRDY